MAVHPCNASTTIVGDGDGDGNGNGNAEVRNGPLPWTSPTDLDLSSSQENSIAVLWTSQLLSSRSPFATVGEPPKAL